MSEDVKRWQSGEYEMIEDSDGLWVWGEDYDAQATEIERLRKKLGPSWEEITFGVEAARRTDLERAYRQGVDDSGWAECWDDNPEVFQDMMKECLDALATPTPAEGDSGEC